MPKPPEGHIPSAPVRIGDTIYAQSLGNKLFTFNLNTKWWRECDGMDIGSKSGGFNKPNIYGFNLPEYVGAKYESSTDDD